MIDLARETRLDVIRQVAQLQESENEKLRRRLSELTAELAAVRGQDPEALLQSEFALLQAQLAAAQQRLFGRSSERRTSDAAASTTEPARPPQTGHGPRVQPTLPVIDVAHALDDADRVCNSCGGALSEMSGQSEESEEIDVVATSYRVVRHLRLKYRCACGGCVETALGPQKLIPGGRYSTGFAVAVAVEIGRAHV